MSTTERFFAAFLSVLLLAQSVRVWKSYPAMRGLAVLCGGLSLGTLLVAVQLIR